MIPNLIGNVPDWKKIFKIAKKYKLKVIEDSADTLGATYKKKSTGHHADISITSFYGSHIINCAGNGGNKATWMRAIVHGTRLGLPVLVLGYAPTRQSDLRQFRIDYIEEFNETKSYLIEFANNIVNDGDTNEINENNFCVKLAGFLPQYVKPNPKDKGMPTEHGIVDVYGNKVTCKKQA